MANFTVLSQEKLLAGLDGSAGATEYTHARKWELWEKRKFHVIFGQSNLETPHDRLLFRRAAVSREVLKMFIP